MADASENPGVKPLSFMEKLSPIVSTYQPQTSASKRISNADPSLVIIASWTDAQDVHIAKYIAKYQQYYPTAPILLIQSTSKLFLNPSTIGPAVRPAVSVIRAVVSPQSPSESSAQILLHIFSNGGSSSMAELYKEYAATATAGETTQMPLHITIFDSSPSIYRIERAMAFLSVGLSPIQRIVAAPFFYLLASAYAALIFLGVWEDMQVVWGDRHNDPDTVLETRRTYIYSDTDKLVGAIDVEAHAGRAEKAGFTVRRERFRGSEHVSHARKDETRYWDIVRGTWDEKYSGK
ncbi:unnamed protein product [Clonostachys solani]|uniref:Indole-diterpene biosynthesis protein PaxU n=1 Tax=Clonostachys solani TaxID=160281 RepID=A0A9N9ZF58_9HYPO|nr:unnamed protein product [Clonostachys solani]